MEFHSEKVFFEAAAILRDSLLASSVLCNSATCCNVTKAEMKLLECADTML